LFAIVDIETTGGNAANGAITEIAVFLHNGQEVNGFFSSLINPGCHIPYYITALTGIDNKMVVDAPSFSDLADQLYNLLHNRVFIAHNVNFDHSFLHHQFRLLDLDFQPKKLCTVRFARKVLPGLKSYSLGNLCRELGIGIENRHRAAGDAKATVGLFEYLLKKDEGGKVLKEMTRGRNAHSYLPMNVPVEMIEQLPYCPGVYYFKDRSGKVVYVGKAINIRYRVKGHFTSNTAGKRRQEMIRNIYTIEFRTCATELMAIILESIEIKRLWPLYNRSQKRFEARYGLYAMEDKAGRVRIFMDKKKKALPALHTFSQLTEGHSLIKKLANDAGLKPEWVSGQYNIKDALPENFNEKMLDLIESLRNHLPDFAVLESGEDEAGRPLQVAYLIQKGAFKGMVCRENLPSDWERLVEAIEPYPENEFIRNTLFSAAFNGAANVLYPSS
jgi:DNA polymerase-3 subunit epsilon